MKNLIITLLLLSALGCGQATEGSVAATESSASSDSTVATTSAEIVEEYEDFEDDPASVSNSSFVVGKWGRVFNGLLYASPNSDDYKSGFQEIEFRSDMSYTWSGWHFGSYFEIRGEYQLRGDDSVYMRSLQIVKDDDGVGKNLIWVDETQGKLVDWEGYRAIQPYANSWIFVLDMKFDRQSGKYVDDQGNKLSPAQ